MSNDGLTKEISTFQVTSLFDVRGIRFECTEAKEVDLDNTSTSGSVTVPTSSPETDSEGETTTGNATSNIDATSITKVQYTQYKIKWTVGSSSENQQFINSDKMTAMFKVDNKITSNINITSDETSATFDVYWNGDLEDTFLKTDTKRCKLFIQMPNKLVYLLDFKQRETAISGT